MFLDRVVITCEAGKGGDGCLSFRREKFVPRGGPDGGDGGRGGDIRLISRGNIESLIDFKSCRRVHAENGRHGSGSNKTGKDGADFTLQVPAGTVVKTWPEEKVLFDFTSPDMEFTLVRGGKGGRGNTRFKSSVNRAPRRFERGAAGEKITVILELKLIAYVGLVGFPNAGKSTLISKISAAKPKIAAYPFTTLSPNLGVVYDGYRSLVVADIPGIIEGAHRGEGMGIEFLRHIERTRVLLFLIDASPDSSHPPLAAFEILKTELSLYQESLLKKKMLVVANKIDLLERTSPPLMQLKALCRKRRIPYLEISALKGTHLPELKRKLFGFYENA